jgi:hypothetical protein
LIRKHVSLKEVESWLKRGQKVPFFREICSPQKIGAITGILLIIKSIGVVGVKYLEEGLGGNRESPHKKRGKPTNRLAISAVLPVLLQCAMLFTRKGIII